MKIIIPDSAIAVTDANFANPRVEIEATTGETLALAMPTADHARAIAAQIRIASDARLDRANSEARAEAMKVGTQTTFSGRA